MPNARQRRWPERFDGSGPTINALAWVARRTRRWLGTDTRRLMARQCPAGFLDVLTGHITGVRSTLLGRNSFDDEYRRLLSWILTVVARPTSLSPRNRSRPIGYRYDRPEYESDAQKCTERPNKECEPNHRYLEASRLRLLEIRIYHNHR